MRRAFALVALLFFPAIATAQLQLATIRGVVLDTQRNPVAGASVVLRDDLGHDIARGTTEQNGQFQIRDVALGSYQLRVEVGRAVLLTQILVVRGSLPIELTLQTGGVVQEEIVVRGDAASNTPEHPWSLAGAALRAVAAVPNQQLQSAIATLPGVMAEDNGLLHVRGVDDGVLYVQDGIPIYERLDRVFGMPPNPSAIASVQVIDGYIPPEFGFKSGAVVEVRSQTGRRDAWSAAAGAGIADERTRHFDVLAAGPVGASTGLMFTLADERSARFLDPVDPDNLHNHGTTTALSGQLTSQASHHLFTFSGQAGRTRSDVPHSLEQEDAGQDQRQRTTQHLVAATWQYVATDQLVWQVSGYSRFGASSLIASANDTPVTSGGRRENLRQGALWSLTYQRGQHTAKAGGEATSIRLEEAFSFAVVDDDDARGEGLTDAAIAHDVDNPFFFADRQRPFLWSVFVQDVYQPSDRLTMNFGARFDRSRMLIRASQWSPRVGVSFRLRRGSVLRGSVIRLFQPPQAEYLLLGSSPEARELSAGAGTPKGGGSSIPPERQTAFDLSFAQNLGHHWRIEAAAWRRRVKDVDDPNIFFGTTVFVPNSVARQHAWGLDLRLEMPEWRDWSAFASYSLAKLRQFGPVTGGLFLEDDLLAIEPGEPFIPDHDQRHSIHGTISYAPGSWRLSASYRYRTGTPVGLDEDDAESTAGRRGSSVVDLGSGRVKPQSVLDAQVEHQIRRGKSEVSLLFWAENLTDQLYAFNFGNPFSGTHFGAPRRFGGTVRVSFE